MPTFESVSAFQRRSADRRRFVLDQNSWQVFDKALTRPAGDVAGLRELLSAATVLDDAPAATASERSSGPDPA